MPENTPPLLTKLQAQIDAPEFAKAIRLSGGDGKPEAFRGECQQIFADLFETAASHWDETLDAEAGWVPKFSGAAVVEHYGPLHSCWLEDFSASIMNVAGDPETSRDERDFLYFMLGVLQCGWQEYIRQLHGKKQQGA